MPSPTVGVLQLKRNDGAPAYVPPRPVLATTAVKHVGDPVAMVVAETLQQAQDAAELVDVDYDVLPSITDTAAAPNPGAPQLWADAPANTCFEWSMGDGAATDAAFARADHVTAVDIVSRRPAAGLRARYAAAVVGATLTSAVDKDQPLDWNVLTFGGAK